MSQTKKTSGGDTKKKQAAKRSRSPADPPTKAQTKAEEFLAKRPKCPLEALWDALRDTKVGTLEVVLALIQHSSCGLERKLLKKEMLMGSNKQYYYRPGPGSTPIHIAAGAGRFDVVEALAELGADVNLSKTAVGNATNALQFAILENVLDVAKTLLKKGAKVDEPGFHGRTALHVAASSGNCAAIEMLLGSNADTNAKDTTNSTPLLLAVEEVQMKAFELLASKGAMLEERHNGGETALMVAARVAPMIIPLLLSLGADPKATCRQSGQTSLHKASENGHAEEILMLISRGADPKAADNEGLTPLHFAAARFFEVGAVTAEAHIKPLQNLVEKGARVDATSAKGWTPLHSAAYGDNVPAINFLLSKGAKPNATNTDGQTPLQVATKNYSENAVATLSSRK
eukprot:GILI01015988.1.p1 GENE.GILI01015988.1~~GILI01015988.1.p1  ORF type:complete len:401 (+),score=72.11 GILI01015988.1:104-1306(+)